MRIFPGSIHFSELCTPLAMDDRDIRTYTAGRQVYYHGATLPTFYSRKRVRVRILRVCQRARERGAGWTSARRHGTYENIVRPLSCRPRVARRHTFTSAAVFLFFLRTRKNAVVASPAASGQLKVLFPEASRPKIFTTPRQASEN